MASRNYRTGVIITGDATGAVQAVNLTREQLDKLNEVQRRTSSESEGMGASLRRSGLELVSLAKQAAGAALAVGTVAGAALVKLTKDGLASADALGKQSDKLGIATEKIAAYNLAALDTGVAQERVYQAIQRSNKLIVDAASGNENAQKTLAALNLEYSSLIRLSPDQAFESIADSIAEIEDPILKSALAMRTFGKSGGELLNFINLGSSGLDQFARKAEVAGLALSREMVAKVELANDAMELLGQMMSGLGQQLAVKVAPVLLVLADNVFAVVEKMGGMSVVAERLFTFLVEGAGKIVTAWEFVSTGFHTVEAIMRSVNMMAATLIEAVLNASAALLGWNTAVGKELRSLSDSFGKEADDEAAKRDAAWAAAAESARNYGKTEEQLKGLMKEVTASADQRAASMVGLAKATASATSVEDAMAASGIAAMKIETERKVVLEALGEEQKKAREELEKTAEAFNLANDPAAKFVAEIEEIKKLQTTGKVTQDAINNAVQKAAEAYADATGAVDLYTEAQERNNELLEEGKRLTESLRTPTEEYTAQLERLEELRKTGAIDDTTLGRAQAQALQDLTDANERAASQASSAWIDFGRNVQEAFRDTFIQAEGNLGDFLERAEQALKEAARRWLFDSTIGRLFAGFGGAGFSQVAAASPGATAANGGGGITSLMGGNYSVLGSLAKGTTGFLYGANTALNTGGSYLMAGLNAAGYNSAATGVGNLFANTSTLGNNVGQAFGFQGGGTLVGGAVTAGAGMVGGYVGNILGEGIFDKKAESNWGSTAGGIAGAYIGAQYGSTFGPWGAAIGALVGALADVALGGDGKKRSNTGVIVGPSAAGGTRAASGLQIAPYDRRGDNQGTAQLQTALLEIDDLLTTIATAAGADVDFSNVALQGRNPDAGHDGPGIFFGGKGFNGGAEGFADAPEAFIRAWIDQINDQLPNRVREIMQGVDGAAEALVSGFAAAVEIDNLLNLDVVKDTKKAIDELMTPQKILIELYDDTTERVMALAAGIDGNAEGLVQLSEALRDQKTAALELALAYQGVQLETKGLFEEASRGIREALMSPDQLYEARRGEIASLTEQLRSTISPDEISRLQQQIVGISNDAFRSLDGGQQQALGQEFLGFLDQARAIAEQQLTAGLESLASREQGIERTIELELSIAQQQQQAAQQQTQAAQTLQHAAEQLGTYVERLTNSQTNFVINFPGIGNFTIPYGLNVPSEVTL